MKCEGSLRNENHVYNKILHIDVFNYLSCDKYSRQPAFPSYWENTGYWKLIIELIIFNNKCKL